MAAQARRDLFAVRRQFFGLTGRLLKWAEHEFRLLKPLPDGSGTQRDALLSFQRQSGLRQAELDPPVQAPPALLYLWEWFWQMSQGRSVSMGGIMPIPPSEMLAWCTLKRIELQRWEFDAIQALDATFMRVAAEK